MIPTGKTVSGTSQPRRARLNDGAFAREAKFLARPLAKVEADGMFEGYASLFQVPDLGRDVVEPGAFAESLRRRGPAGVKLLWQHDPAEPIGR
ncbi:MAG: HK97 family phage prohead protease, partial [Bosea sp. (in: a-proteobacteria)]